MVLTLRYVEAFDLLRDIRGKRSQLHAVVAHEHIGEPCMLDRYRRLFHDNSVDALVRLGDGHRELAVSELNKDGRSVPGKSSRLIAGSHGRIALVMATPLSARHTRKSYAMQPVKFLQRTAVAPDARSWNVRSQILDGALTGVWRVV
jgi:hypothetical protein